jgi:signal peptidase II
MNSKRKLRKVMGERRSSRGFHLLIAALVVILDRASKQVISKTIPLHHSIQVIPHFFRLIHLENSGAAFSLFADSSSPWKMTFLVAFSITALVIVGAMLWRSNHAMASTGIGLSLILGGAVGNLWDRLLHGRVVDFLLFYVGQYEWPAFNVADSAIVIGAGLLFFEIMIAKAPSPQRSA